MPLSVWEEIQGFTSSGEYKRFVQYIEDQMQSGVAREYALILATRGTGYTADDGFST
jgi:hypothetical protein